MPSVLTAPKKHPEKPIKREKKYPETALGGEGLGALPKPMPRCARKGTQDMGFYSDGM